MVGSATRHSYRKPVCAERAPSAKNLPEPRKECTLGAKSGSVTRMNSDGGLPGRADIPGGGAEEASWQATIPAAQAIAQHHRLDRGNRHALPAHGAEAGHRLTDNQQAIGGPAQLVVAPPAVRGNAKVHYRS